jgi:ER degradation enhancer, mannosidase alpha-like 1
MMKSQKPVKEPGIRRRSEIQLHFIPDFVDPMFQPRHVLADDMPSEDVVITAYTASFGGDPAAPLAESAQPLAFGHGSGVPIVRGWNNTFGCKPYSETFHDEAIVVQRGECTFFEKLVYAMEAGASGVVVINTDDNNVWPNAEKEEIKDAGEHLNEVALVVIMQSAGKIIERMLDVADDLDGQVWMMVGPEAAGSDSQPTPEPSRTQKGAEAESRMLYINGHGLINTRLQD